MKVCLKSLGLEKTFFSHSLGYHLGHSPKKLPGGVVGGGGALEIYFTILQPVTSYAC